ncbi:membrane protein [Mesorhizobium sp. L-8-10]|nr:membrane protein [Mesorhizobium sp. L-8-10]
MSMVWHSRRHLPFYSAAICGILVLATAYRLPWNLVAVAAANTFFLVYLLLSGMKVPRLTASFLKRHAAEADEPFWILLGVSIGTILVAAGSLVILFVVINSERDPVVAPWLLGFSFIAVWLAWLTIHTMAALHYAHKYWEPEERTGGATPDEPFPRRGLDFPHTKDPEGFDFLYFAFVIGMTAQTSDTEVTTKAMRKLTLLHGIASFFFNTVLVAAAVNLAVSLGQQP